NTEVRNGTACYLINLNSGNPAHAAWGRHLEIPDDQIKKIEQVPYDGEVWDFETEDHVFHAGLGRNLVHNTGPRRGETFATSNFAKQIAEMEAGLREPVVHVGDLKPTRDFSDVRDIVRGYWVLLERGTPGEVYNLCSGVDWSIQRGSREKVETTLGWRPAIPLETTLTDLLEYWRRRIRSRVS